MPTFSIVEPLLSSTDREARREWLRIGGLSALGVSLPQLLRAAEVPNISVGAGPKLAGELGSTLGQARNVTFLWLQGGPPQRTLRVLRISDENSAPPLSSSLLLGAMNTGANIRNCF